MKEERLRKGKDVKGYRWGVGSCLYLYFWFFSLTLTRLAHGLECLAGIQGNRMGLLLIQDSG